MRAATVKIYELSHGVVTAGSSSINSGSGEGGNIRRNLKHFETKSMKRFPINRLQFQFSRTGGGRVLTASIESD